MNCMDKKVLLINAPITNSVDTRKFPPLGLATMASALRKHGFKCDLLDGDLLDIDNGIIDTIVKKSIQYSLVGISATMPTFKTAVNIAINIKKVIDVPIILGGHCATFLHDTIIEKNDCFDAIIVGEGETAIINLCIDYFSNGLFSIPLDYITYKNINGNKHIAKNIAIEEDLNTLPFPTRENCTQYSANEKILTISSSRGCPYGCNFCSATNFRNKWSSRSPENIAQEVYNYYKLEKDFKILFVDDNFYMDPVRSINVLDQIQKKCNTQFELTFATRADQILNNGEYYLSKLKELGCSEIELGIENGSESILKRYNKNVTVEQNRLTIQLLSQYGIKPVIDYILFDPKTSKEELKENIDFLKRSNLWGYDPPLIYEKIIAFPGTQFSKDFPHLFDEDFNIPSSKYFYNGDVLEIYRMLQLFRISYQNKIDFLIKKIRNHTMNSDKCAISDSFKKLIFLKKLPYALLEYLVYSTENYNQAYENFIVKLKVKKNLDEIAQLY